MIQKCKSKNGQYFNRVVARNGKILCVSETFKNKRSAQKNIEALIKAVLKGKTLTKYYTINKR